MQGRALNLLRRRSAVLDVLDLIDALRNKHLPLPGLNAPLGQSLPSLRTANQQNTVGTVPRRPRSSGNAQRVPADRRRKGRGVHAYVRLT